MTDPMPLIRADSLNCGYGKQPVLHDVSFSLAAGLVHGLIGANGTGNRNFFRPTYSLIRGEDLLISP